MVIKFLNNKMIQFSREFKKNFCLLLVFIYQLRFKTMKVCHKQKKFGTHTRILKLLPMGGCPSYWPQWKTLHGSSINRQKRSSELKKAISNYCHKCWCTFDQWWQNFAIIYFLVSVPRKFNFLANFYLIESIKKPECC